MRIVAGKFKRRILLSPKGRQTRPTTDRVREAAFNLIDVRLDLFGATILDLFAGTGALGLEALSRGASSVLFIESNRTVLQYARTNAVKLDVVRQCSFIPMNVTDYLRRPQNAKFDLILADPPYDLIAMPELPELALNHLSEKGLFVLEHDKRIRFDDHRLAVTSRKYGRTIVSVFAGAHND